MSKLRVDELESLSTGKSIMVDEIDTDVRLDLASPDKGAAMVSYLESNVSEALDSKVTQVFTVADLRNTEPLYVGQLVYVLEYVEGTGYGGGLYKAVDSSYSWADSEETLGGARWRIVTESNVFPIDRLGALRDSHDSVRDAFIRAIECVREVGGGTVLIPPGEWSASMIQHEVNLSDITFKFEKGGIFRGHVLLGWYPYAANVRYQRVSFEGEGTILPSDINVGSWHNDLVYVDGISVRDLTFIEPITLGHFLDLNGCSNVTVDGIKVFGSSVSTRAFAEFIQIAQALPESMGWYDKGVEYADFFDGSPTNNVLLTKSVFLPYEGVNGVSYPPRPIGNHDTNAQLRSGGGIRIENCIFKDVVYSSSSGRLAWIELPSARDVVVSGNTFLCTGDAIDDTSSYAMLEVWGGTDEDSLVVRDNMFILPDKQNYSIAIAPVDTTSFSIVNNTFHVSASNSHVLDISRASGTGFIHGNTVRSSGRRFVWRDSTARSLKCTISGNNLHFTPDPADYRPPITLQTALATVYGNTIEHPSDGIEIPSGSVSNNAMLGGASKVRIVRDGVLYGNLFNTTNAPNVSIGSAAQTSQGWNFVHIPA